MSEDRVPCPACGGAGGGPFGPPGSAWDIETYECPRCFATGFVPAITATAVPRPLAKGSDRDTPKEQVRPAKTGGARGK